MICMSPGMYGVRTSAKSFSASESGSCSRWMAANEAAACSFAWLLPERIAR